jgi:hypothetical protein
MASATWSTDRMSIVIVDAYNDFIFAKKAKALESIISSVNIYLWSVTL